MLTVIKTFNYNIYLISCLIFYQICAKMLIFFPTSIDTFVNSADPDEMSHVIRIYTVCHSVSDSRLKHNWTCPDSRVEECMG